MGSQKSTRCKKKLHQCKFVGSFLTRQTYTRIGETYLKFTVKFTWNLQKSVKEIYIRNFHCNEDQAAFRLLPSNFKVSTLRKLIICMICVGWGLRFEVACEKACLRSNMCLNLSFRVSWWHDIVYAHLILGDSSARDVGRDI